MISKAELHELDALARTLCKVCGPRVKGWIEERREAAAAKKRKTPAGADGPLDKAAFVRALTACSKLAARCTGDAHGLVEIAHWQDCVALRATDGEIFVTYRFERPSNNPDALGLFDVRQPLSWLRSRKGKHMDARIDDGRLVLRVGDATARFKPREVLPDFTLPKPPGGKARKLATIFPSDLRLLFKRTVFAASDSVHRYAVNCVRLEARKDGVAAATTNRRCLAWSGFVGDVINKGQPLIPLFAVGIIDGLLRDINEAVEVCVVERGKKGVDLFALSSPSLDVQCRQVEGTFPLYEEILYADSDVAVEVDRAELLAAVKDVAPFCTPTDSQRGAFRLTAANGGLVLRSHAKEHRDQRFKVAGEFRGEHHSSAYLDPFYVEDMLKVLDDEHVTVEMRGFETGISVKADCFRYVQASVGTDETEKRLDRKIAAMKEASDDAE